MEFNIGDKFESNGTELSIRTISGDIIYFDRRVPPRPSGYITIGDGYYQATIDFMKEGLESEYIKRLEKD